MHLFRTRADVAAIAAAARRRAGAVVVGGGLLGLEAAAGLLARGMRVTAVEAADRLMPQQLDAGGAAMLRRALSCMGLGAVVGSTVDKITEHEVLLGDGQALEAELVVVAAGIRPEVTLAREAGVATARGVLVDDAMRTDAPGVWAVGECAEHRGTVYGLWGPLAEQARVAGAAVCGDPGGFSGAVPATTLKVAGVDLYAGGAQSAGTGQDELIFSDGRSGTYRKLVLDGDRLAGAVLVGDTKASRELSGLLRSHDSVPERLLGTPGQSVEEPEPSPEDTVCSCNAVTEGRAAAGDRRGRALHGGRSRARHAGDHRVRLVHRGGRGAAAGVGARSEISDRSGGRPSVCSPRFSQLRGASDPHLRYDLQRGACRQILGVRVYVHRRRRRRDSGSLRVRKVELRQRHYRTRRLANTDGTQRVVPVRQEARQALYGRQGTTRRLALSRRRVQRASRLRGVRQPPRHG